MNAEILSCIFTPCPICGGRGMTAKPDSFSPAITVHTDCPNGCRRKRFGPLDFTGVFVPVVGYGWNEATGECERNHCEDHLP